MAFAIIFFLLFARVAPAQTIQEQLGYSKDTKLLIVHGDDLGVSHAENEATIDAMENGSVSSASIMVPTPWFSEIAAYARAHPKADVGLHLTLTSEWQYYKWSPVADGVNGLRNKEGFLFAGVDSVYQSATIAEVEKELRAQIEKARLFGIDFTHFDSHMGTMFGRPEYMQLYIKLGREYHVPVLLSREGTRSKPAVAADDTRVDTVYSASPGDFANGMAAYYSSVLTSLRPGLSLIIIHAAFDDKEMQAVTVGNVNWGARWRQEDYNFFSSDKCRRLLQEQHIRLITWREIRDKLVR
jgi:predicted glycoside hydrolase/deacetylase ChbG (UPF0249 family)